MPTTSGAAPDVREMTDTQLLDAMDALGCLFGGDPEEGPEGTEWLVQGWSTGSFREALRQRLEQQRAQDAVAAAPAPLIPVTPQLSDADDDLPF